jgi:hypothetical protein
MAPTSVFYHAAVSDEPEILVGFSSPGFVRDTAPSDWTLTFWLHDENDKFRRLDRRERKSGGDRYFLVILPHRVFARGCLHPSGSFEWVETIPGGDPPE